MERNKYSSSEFGQLHSPEEFYNHWSWLYALCREYLFRDHTLKISESLFPVEGPAVGTRVLEIACGPGLYACSLARRYSQVLTTGIDLSCRLLQRAEVRAARYSLSNCNFLLGDARAVPFDDHSFDAVVVSRLFLIVGDHEAILSEIFRVLRPGGRCFIAEPTSRVKTHLLSHVMRWMAHFFGPPDVKLSAPRKVTILSPYQFRALVASQGWSEMRFENDGSYQFAVCSKVTKRDQEIVRSTTKVIGVA
jgi:arsenite methyltransferase